MENRRNGAVAHLSLQIHNTHVTKGKVSKGQRQGTPYNPGYLCCTAGTRTSTPRVWAVICEMIGWCEVVGTLPLLAGGFGGIGSTEAIHLLKFSFCSQASMPLLHSQPFLRVLLEKPFTATSV
jgi:hypothetical protein